MKSLAGNSVAEFWSWFRDNAETIARNIDQSSTINELDRRILDFAPTLSWEIGPGLEKPWQFVVSPGLDCDLRETARAIVAVAPGLEDWEFHSAKQPKDWDYKVEVADKETGRCIRADAKGWRFVLLRYPDGVREILIEATELAEVSDRMRSEVCEIVLGSLLGEDVLMDAVNEFGLVDRFEPRFAEKARPIQQLRSAITSKSK